QEDPSLSPLDNKTADHWLRVTREIAALAHQTTTLGEALNQVGAALHAQLGSRAWTALRVEGWNGESALLRPWVAAQGDGSDLIDVSAIASSHRDEAALGEALSTLQQSCTNAPAHTHPWRAPHTRRILALPVSIDGWPIALLEFDDACERTDNIATCVDVATIQLNFVAQREANLAHMATSAEHLGRLGLVASRISSGVAITDRDGVVEWINSAFVALTGWPEDK